jgi:hypothetical protein
MGNVGNTAIKFGTTYQLGAKREDWLWNVAKRALPEGASDSAILSYMKFLAKENGIDLDDKNNVKPTTANRSVMGKPIKIPEYKAPTLDEIKNGAQLSPHMTGDSVKEVKKLLNKQNPELKLDENDPVYDDKMKAGIDQFRKSQGLTPRRDGVINATSLARLSNPNASTTDKVDPNNPNTKSNIAPVDSTTSMKGGREPKINELETDKNFAALAEDQKMDVRRAMRGKGPEVQDRMAALAKDPNFKLLSAGNRKQILQLAESNDPAVQSVVKDIVSSDKFHKADDRVKKGVMDLLVQDKGYAKQVQEILDAKGGTEEQLKMLETAKSKAPTSTSTTKDVLGELERTPAYRALQPDQQRDVRDAFANADAEAYPRLSQLAQMPGFAKLSGPDRKQVLALAENKSPEMFALLSTICNTDKYTGADDRVKKQVLDLATGADASKLSAIDRILLKGGSTEELLSQLSALK